MRSAGCAARQAGTGWTPAIAASRAVSGGILVTVVGSLAADRMSTSGAPAAGSACRCSSAGPSRYLDPGVPDDERALARRGTTLVGTVKSGALVEVVARGTLVVDEAAGGVRARSRGARSRAPSAAGARSPAAIVDAIVIGDRAGLDDEVQRRLQEAGTYHVIAISGGNIAILAGLLLGAVPAGRAARARRRCSRRSPCSSRTRDLVGGGASVDRATLMAVVYFAARAFDQRSPPLNALAVVAAVLVAADPLVGRRSRLPPDLRRHARHPRRRAIVRCHDDHAELAEAFVLCGSAGSALCVVSSAMLAASVAAEALLFPVGALVFSRVTFAGLALNFLAIPLMAVAQIAGHGGRAAGAGLEPLAASAGWVAHVGAGGLVWSADLVRFAPALTWRVAPPAWARGRRLLRGRWSSCWTLWRRRSPAAGSAEPRMAARVRRSRAGGRRCRGGRGSSLNRWTLLAARGDGRLHVTFLDVGQGDCALRRFPRGPTMLVDAGGLAGVVVASTSATGSSRRCCATPASDGSTTSC